MPLPVWLTDWAVEVLADLARLFHVPRPLWLALLALTLLRFAVGLVWADGGAQIGSRASGAGRLRAIRANAAESFRLFAIVLAFTLGGNARPALFGWVVVAAWLAGVWFTVRYVLRTASPAESDLRAAFGALQSEISRRNLNSMSDARGRSFEPRPERPVEQSVAGGVEPLDAAEAGSPFPPDVGQFPPENPVNPYTASDAAAAPVGR